MLEALLPYYEQELTQLRQLGREFAERYPKIAGRLLLSEDRCEDPHAERMIEAFAFLAARIHRKLDDEFPQITEALLNILYPHYLRPIPSMTIARFDPVAASKTLTGMVEIPRHSGLNSTALKGQPCRFRTTYPVEIGPIAVTEVSLVSVADPRALRLPEDVNGALRVRLKCSNPQIDFTRLPLSRLRFFINQDMSLGSYLYELLFGRLARVAWLGADGWTRLAQAGADVVSAVGFDEQDGLLDYDARSFLGYRLLTEYFAFPEKFLFLDVNGFERLQGLAGAGDEIVLSFYLRDLPDDEITTRLARSLTPDSLLLFCTPAVNLFQQPADPILLTHTKTEYPVQVDSRRPLGLEVYAIESVVKVENHGTTGEKAVPFEPFYSIRHGAGASDRQAYWHARRVPSSRAGDRGTDVVLSVVDSEFLPANAQADALSLNVSCTNRDLPTLLPIGRPDGDFTLDAGSTAYRIQALRKPTDPIRPDGGRGQQWRLISHLSLNHLSLLEGGRDALVEMLSLYNYRSTPVLRKLIEGIRDLHCQPGYAMLHDGPFPSAVRGVDVTLTLDATHYVGSGAFLFSAVLDRFLGLYCAPNSFVRLRAVTDQDQTEVAQWPARSGTAILA